jgi:hypothetical protein
MNGLIAKTLDIGQRLFSLFLANALPAVTGGAVLGVSVAKAAALAGFMAVVQVVQKLAALSVDGDLTADEIKTAFSNGAVAKPEAK